MPRWSKVVKLLFPDKHKMDMKLLCVCVCMEPLFQPVRCAPGVVFKSLVLTNGLCRLELPFKTSDVLFYYYYFLLKSLQKGLYFVHFTNFYVHLINKLSIIYLKLCSKINIHEHLL